MDVMIDLETLGKGENAVVVSVGVVVFDIEKKEILDKYYAALSLSSQLKKGRSVDASVLRYWIGMDNPEAKAVFKEETKDPKVSLNEIWQMLDKYRPLDVWGNGSGFDVNIMESLYNMYEEKIPWTYTKVNDLRTFVRFIGNKEKLPKSSGDHNALNDAIKQVEYVLKHYKGGGK